MALAGRLNTPKMQRPPNPPLKIESRIGVMAPPEAVWAVLEDVSRWPTWNPIYPAAEGKMGIGARWALTVALPGMAHRRTEPVMMDWVPLEQILLYDVAWGGWAKSVRYIEIDQVEKEACIISNGELFQGLVSEFYGNRQRRELKAGFQAMSEALKRQAETLWADQKP